MFQIAVWSFKLSHKSILVGFFVRWESEINDKAGDEMHTGAIDIIKRKQKWGQPINDVNVHLHL